MARYLLKVSYTADGAKGLIAEGGSSRVAVVETLVAGLGGTLESFDFALGGEDAYCVVELPGVDVGGRREPRGRRERWRAPLERRAAHPRADG